MTASWPSVALGSVLQRVTEAVTPRAEEEYREVTVKLWGRGVIQRRLVAGAQLNGGRRFVARAGQLILSRIDARNGAIGIVPPELDGALVTNDFPLFEMNRSRIEPRFLGWMSQTRSFVQLCKQASEGTTNRVRLQEPRFLAAEIPLPSLAEQRRIVGRIEQLSMRLAKVTSLQSETARALESLPRTLLFSDTSVRRIAMMALLRPREPDVSVRPDQSYQFAGVYSFGRGVFKAQVRAGSEFAYTRLTRLHAGEFTYPKLMAWEGAFGVVPVECDECVVSPEFPVFEIDENAVLPEVVDTYFRTPSVWDVISGASTGTNVRRRRLNPRTLLAHEMPLPDMVTQRRIRDVRRKADTVSSLQSDTARALDRLLASTMDHAFRGAL